MPDSSQATTATTVRAQWCFPVDQPGWENAWLTIRDGKILERGKGHPGRTHIDLGDVAILPGLINPHTHLEFSDLKAPLGTPGTPFPDWVSDVIRWRRGQVSDPTVARAMKTRAIQTGIAESYRNGVYAIGEIASPPWQDFQYSHSLLPIRLFHEFLGLTPDRSEAAWSCYADRCEAVVPPVASGYQQLQLGVSPHAPYTVRLEDVARLGSKAAEQHQPLAMHLAESPEEMEMVDRGSGGFVDMLQSVDAWDPTALGSQPSIRAYLKAVLSSPVKQFLVVHGNFLRREDLELLQQFKDRATVIYCPRTHTYFGHSAYPLQPLLSRGIPVALGTDSRASNPDLSLWRDAQSVAGQFPDIPGDQILRMVTENGARALMLENGVGTLKTGTPWTGIAVDSRGLPSNETDPLRFLLQNDDAHPYPVWPLAPRTS